MAGYAANLGEQEKKESRWISLSEGVHVVRVLPPSKDFFDPAAPPLTDCRYVRKVIFNFPIKGLGDKNLVVDSNHIIVRALRDYQKTLSPDHTRQTELMRQNGMSKWWAKPRGAYNAITTDKKDQPYWLDLPKTVDQELHDLIKKDPSIIDLDRGRMIRITITGKGQYDKKYKIEVSPKPSVVTLSFDPALLDDIKSTLPVTEVDWRKIGEPTIAKYAIEIMKSEAEAERAGQEFENSQSSVSKPAVRSTPAARPVAKAAVADDGFGDGFADSDSPTPATKPSVSTSAATKAAPKPGFAAEKADADALRTQLAADEPDDGFGDADGFGAP